jgi:hypothetical protein
MHLQMVHYAFTHMVLCSLGLACSLQLLCYGFMYGFLLRHGVMASYLVVNVVNIKCDLITLHNFNNFIIFLVVPWGT